VFYLFIDKSWLNLQFHDEEKQYVKKPDEIQIDKKDYPPSIGNNRLLNRIQGSMFGLAIGDALGAHVEFRPHSYLESNPVIELQGGGTWGLEKGQVIIYTNLTTSDYISKRFFTAISIVPRKNTEC